MEKEKGSEEDTEEGLDDEQQVMGGRRSRVDKW
jgi:hypothetical protein